jgi:hypothetical protein
MLELLTLALIAPTSSKILLRYHPTSGQNTLYWTQLYDTSTDKFEWQTKPAITHVEVSWFQSAGASTDCLNYTVFCRESPPVQGNQELKDFYNPDARIQDALKLQNKDSLQFLRKLEVKPDGTTISSFNADAVKENQDPYPHQFPQAPVGKGDHWTAQLHFKLKETVTYTVLDIAPHRHAKCVHVKRASKNGANGEEWIDVTTGETVESRLNHPSHHQGTITNHPQVILVRL